LARSIEDRVLADEIREAAMGHSAVAGQWPAPRGLPKKLKAELTLEVFGPFDPRQRPKCSQTRPGGSVTADRYHHRYRGSVRASSTIADNDGRFRTIRQRGASGGRRRIMSSRCHSRHPARRKGSYVYVIKKPTTGAKKNWQSGRREWLLHETTADASGPQA